MVDATTVSSFAAAFLAVITIGIRAVLYARMTGALERQQERIMNATPAQLEMLKGCQLPEPSKTARLLLMLLLLAVTANGAVAVLVGYDRYAAYNKCSECNEDQKCVGGRCVATTAQPTANIIWAIRRVPKNYDYALGEPNARR